MLKRKLELTNYSAKEIFAAIMKLDFGKGMELFILLGELSSAINSDTKKKSNRPKMEKSKK